MSTTFEEMVQKGTEALEHFGVKGMRWGVRKDRSDTVVKSKVTKRGASDIVVKTKSGRGVTNTKGGKRNPVDSEVVAVKAIRQKGKGSTTDSLSKDELKQAIDRMKLEKQYRDLEKAEPIVKRGKDFVIDLLEAMAKG